MAHLDPVWRGPAFGDHFSKSEATGDPVGRAAISTVLSESVLVCVCRMRTGLVRNDGHSLPFKNDSFDAVLLFAVLTCIPDGNEQRLLLAEAARVLRPGGLLYVSDLLVNNDRRNRERYEQYAEAYGWGDAHALPSDGTEEIFHFSFLIFHRNRLTLKYWTITQPGHRH